ncbi:DegV family protein [Chloroherpeton thalassium ATCC 35110]|uniref:DegV family protein n=1 Tax=Chloroherpeton thalassium (strain ATCC 35110 / GB-78) TaxID=517418 RepID=B3QU11_CHLT3|nr:DegV family protein [Chloroherpeton thalassium]ACF12809.1 DegV family protein [Chloroherpeton thalassium ATCC 35110]
MRIALVTDSACDLPIDLVYSYNIRCIPMRVIIDGKIRYDNGIDLDNDTFYTQFANPKSLTTMATEPPSVDEFIQFYKRLCIDYDAVLSIHVASRLSDTVKHARAAAVKGADSFRQQRLQKNIGTPFQIRVIDSQNISIGSGLLVIRAAELLQEDVAFPKLANELELLANESYTFSVLDDPSYLKSGKNAIKVPLLASKVANAFSIKPILSCHRGEISVVDRKFGYESAVQEAMNIATEQMHQKSSYEKVGMSYAGVGQELMTNAFLLSFRSELAGMGLTSFSSITSPTLGAYTGPKCMTIGILNSDIKVQAVSNDRQKNVAMQS